MTTNNSQNGHRWLYSNTAGYTLNGLLFQSVIDSYSLMDPVFPEDLRTPRALGILFDRLRHLQDWLIQGPPEAARHKIGPSSRCNRFVRFRPVLFFDTGILCIAIFFIRAEKGLFECRMIWYR